MLFAFKAIIHLEALTKNTFKFPEIISLIKTCGIFSHQPKKISESAHMEESKDFLNVAKNVSGAGTMLMVSQACSGQISDLRTPYTERETYL